MRTKQKYRVTFKLEGGATVTKDILAACEGNAAAAVVARFKAKAITKISKVR